MSQNTNSTKNLIISLALLTFIVSSGAFTVYQFIKKQSSEQPTISNISKPSLRVDQSLTTSSVMVTSSQANNGETMKKDIASKSSDIKVTFDPYISGQSITGMIDNTDKIQSFVVKYTEIDQPNNVLEFKPTIDDQKNFKILLYDNVKNGNYKVEYIITDLDQKETKGTATINVKTNVDTLIAQKEIMATEIQAPIETNKQTEKQSEIKQETSIQNTPQTPQAPIENVNTYNPALSDNNAIVNADAVRTGGANITVLLAAIAIVFLGYAKLLSRNSKKPNINIIFGKTK